MKSKREHAIELQRNYLKQWRAKNREKVQIYNQNYWERKAEKLLQEEKKPSS